MLLSTVVWANDLDTVQNGFVVRMQRFFQESSKRSLKDLEMDRAAIRQNRVLEEIKLMANQSRAFLKKGFDSIKIDRNLASIKHLHELSKDGVFEHKGSAQSSRNLTVTYNILGALSIEIKRYKKEVDSYQDKLIKYQLKLDSLSNDPALFVVSNDSADLARYLQRLRVVATDMSPLTIRLAQEMNNLHDIQNRINMELIKIDSDMEEIEYYQGLLSTQLMQRNFVNIWSPSHFDRSLQDIVYFSGIKAKLLFNYYLKAHMGKFFILLLLTIVILMYINKLKRAIDIKKLTHSSFCNW